MLANPDNFARVGRRTRNVIHKFIILTYLKQSVMPKVTLRRDTWKMVLNSMKSRIYKQGFLIPREGGVCIDDCYSGLSINN